MIRSLALDPVDVGRLPGLRALSGATLAAMRRVSHVLPFRVTPYVSRRVTRTSLPVLQGAA